MTAMSTRRFETWSAASPRVAATLSPPPRVSESRSPVTEPNPTFDRTLLQRIVARDESAVAELYDRHSRAVYSLILRILRTPSDAEEVLQEVFVRVWTRADTYDERLGSPAAWLMRIARNRAIDRFRSRRSRHDAEPQVDATGLEMATSAADSPELLTQGVATSDAVRGALQTLPDPQRMLIEAAFFDGYTHQELAEKFAIPLGTVKTRIRTGMMALRERLEHLV
jgi:RNA polymerase sigma-70 factor, ECF subfamily